MNKHARKTTLVAAPACITSGFQHSKPMEEIFYKVAATYTAQKKTSPFYITIFHTTNLPTEYMFPGRNYGSRSHHPPQATQSTQTRHSMLDHRDKEYRKK
jgi:hypothetical protein